MLNSRTTNIIVINMNRTNFAKPCAFESQSQVLRVSIPLAHHLLTLCLTKVWLSDALYSTTTRTFR